ncbi:MAG: acyltransferase family protein [Ktedonobacterales bacterium]
MGKTKPPRRYELDWLRVGLVIGAMILHVISEAQVFFPQSHSYVLTDLIPTFAVQCGLPSLFLVAGASAWLSLAHRTGWQFMTDRVLRLLVPLIGGVLTILPAANYIASLLSPGPHLSFFQYYVSYFKGYAQFFHGNPLDHLLPLLGDLWFIFVIFLLSILTLPLIVALKGSGGARVIAGFATVCQLPGGTLIAGLVFILCAWLLGVALGVTTANTVWLAFLYPLSFIGGVFLYADPSIEQAIFRDGPAALVLGTLCFVVGQILVTIHALPPPHSGSYVFTAILQGSFPWFGAIAFLGLGKRFFSFTNATLKYLNEAAFPYFLLHILILSIFGYIFLRQPSLPGVLQGVAIIACSFASLTLLYEFVIKRNPVLRFIFGMK